MAFYSELSVLSVGDISIGVAFLAGIVTFLSPCILPVIPAYISWINRFFRMRYVHFAANFVAIVFFLSIMTPVYAHTDHDSGGTDTDVQKYFSTEIGSSFSIQTDSKDAQQASGGLTEEEVVFKNAHGMAYENQRTFVKLFVLAFMVVLVVLNIVITKKQKFLRYIKQINMVTGMMVLNMLIVLIGTGIVLSFGYLPFPGFAYDSVVGISQSSIFSLIRNIHYWATDILIMLTILHLTRVIFTTVVDRHKRVAYWSGLAMFVLIGLTALFGTFLRSDQEAYEAFAHFWIGTQEYLPASINVVFAFIGFGDTALMRFFILHSIVLPISIILIILFHALYAKTFKGIVLQTNIALQRALTKAKKSSTIFPQLRIIGYATLVLWIVVLILAVILPAPLLSTAFNGLEITKPPWYLLWVYGFENIWGMSTIIIVPLGSLLLLIFLPFLSRENGRIDPAAIVYSILLIGFFGFSFYAILGGTVSHLAM